MPKKTSHRQVRLKELLMEQKRRMWTGLRDDIFRRLGKEYNAQFSSPQDVEDLALIDIIEDTGIALADIKRQEIEALEASIKRLEEGTYGICSVCGVEIDTERLKVMPFAECCVKCKCKGETAKMPTL